MDTKWKNIKSKAKSFLEKCWLSSTGIAVKLFCFVLAGFGIAFWYSVVVYRTIRPENHCFSGYWEMLYLEQGR